MGDIQDKMKKVGFGMKDKAGEMYEVSKYKARILSQKNEIEKLQMQIGKYVYDLYKDDNESELFDEEIIDSCHAIDATYDEIAILENKIDTLKAEEE